VFKDCFPALKTLPGNHVFLPTTVSQGILPSPPMSVSSSLEIVKLMIELKPRLISSIGIVVIKCWLISVREIINQRDQLIREIVTKRLYCCTTCARYIYCRGSFLSAGLSLVNRKYMARAFVKLGTWISIPHESRLGRGLHRAGAGSLTSRLTVLHFIKLQYWCCFSQLEPFLSSSKLNKL